VKIRLQGPLDIAGCVLWSIILLPMAAAALFFGLHALVDGHLNWGIGSRTGRHLPITLVGIEARVMGVGLILFGMFAASFPFLRVGGAWRAVERRFGRHAFNALAAPLWAAAGCAVLAYVLRCIRVEGAMLVTALIPIALIAGFIWFLVWAFR